MIDPRFDLRDNNHYEDIVTIKPLNIYQRINEVRKQLFYIQKDKKVMNYKAVTHDAVTAEIRRYLVDTGIVIVPVFVSSSFVDTTRVTSQGGPIYRYEAIYNIEFVNMDSPEDKVIVPIEAHADDTSDKAPGKVISYCTKYAILKLFSIETGEDDESRVEGVNKELYQTQECINRYQESINSIVTFLSNDDLNSAAESLLEIPHEHLQLIWFTPTGKKAKRLGLKSPFNTRELNILKSDEFSKICREMKLANSENVS